MPARQQQAAPLDEVSSLVGGRKIIVASNRGPVEFHRDAARDRHPALAFTHRGRDDDRGAGIAAQAPHLERVRAGEQLDRAVGGGLEPHRVEAAPGSGQGHYHRGTSRRGK